MCGDTMLVVLCKPLLWLAGRDKELDSDEQQCQEERGRRAFSLENMCSGATDTAA